MNDETDYVYHEINRYILLLRAETDVEKRQEYLDQLVTLNKEYKRLCDK